MTQVANPEKVFQLLHQRFPGVKCALNFENPWQLLVATILSAQCTDVRVNLITANIFKKYPQVKDIDALDINDLIPLIKSAGFYNHKAKSIKASARLIMEKFQGQVPANMADLISLPGVARKTANVVLANAFHINEGIAVDTHVTRITNLLGFVNTKDAVKIEKQLINLYKREQWADISHLLIIHGRTICIARKPKCSECPLKDICPSFK